MELTEQQWADALAHFNAAWDSYDHDITVNPARNTTLGRQPEFKALLARYEAAERTQELYDAMNTI